MRIALISDIHGNHMAFEAVLRHVRETGVDGIAFLGDYVTDFPGSHKVLEMVREACREWQCWVLKGNREDYLLEHRHGRTPAWRKGTAFGSLLYAYNDLTEADLDYIENLPYTMDVRIDGVKPFTICHSSPRGSRDPICHNEPQIAECLELIKTDYMFCGHQHVVRTYCHMHKRAYFVGSVGLCDAMAGHAQFAYAEYEAGQWLVKSALVPYDAEAAISEFGPSGYDDHAREWAKAIKYMARTGYDACIELVRRANILAGSIREDGGIPEKYWQQAAKDMGLGSCTER
ncbi:MAG: metallophosphoesterase [Clostridia bacterium]|nr:metallophosphoesterase [Clostridia bacterium]